MENKIKISSKSQEFLRYAQSAFYASLIVQFLHPFDVIKTRLQSHDGLAKKNLVPNYQGIKGAIKTIYREEGIRGFSKGILISLAANSLGRILFFAFFEERKYSLFKIFGQNSQVAVLIASIYASTTATLLTQPLWMLQSRVYMNTQKSVSGFKNIICSSREIYYQYGVFGFYRGLPLSLLLCSHGIIQINSSDKVRNGKNTILIDPFLCGLISKMFAIFVTYPISTVRTRIQQNQFIGENKPKYVNIMDVIQKTIQIEGIQGLFKGIPAAMLKGVPQKGIYFMVYEQIKLKMNVPREK